MRLLNTATHCFQEFFDDTIPEYAILSHRWETDEVSFEDFVAGRLKQGAGYAKILRCSTLAASQGLEWVWVDTCCIDKRSSAELSEAINSMYRWYQNAEVCFAYLSDVFPTSDGGASTCDGVGRWKDSFVKSAWFTRGWTLQEYLAPKRLLFLDHRWQCIGTKLTLAAEVSKITGIESQVCHGTKTLAFCCVAQRMSWAAGRQTSRIEDRAYSLMGIFDINMPLLYGEGQKAFLRLQEEIIRRSDDDSIFAWFRASDRPGRVLALSPDHFATSATVERWICSTEKRRPYLITNRGLQMDLRLRRTWDERPGIYLLPLNCRIDGQWPLALVLQKDHINDRFFCKDCIRLGSTGLGAPKKSSPCLKTEVFEIYV